MNIIISSAKRSVCSVQLFNQIEMFSCKPKITDATNDIKQFIVRTKM